MELDYDKHFEQRMERSLLERGEQQLLHPSSQSELLGAYCREQDKFAMRIVWSGRLPKDPDDIEEAVRTHLFRMDKPLESQIATHLIVGREAVLFFDDQVKMEEKYNDIGNHGVDGNPFYVCTIHRKGIVLTENT